MWSASTPMGLTTGFHLFIGASEIMGPIQAADLGGFHAGYRIPCAQEEPELGTVHHRDPNRVFRALLVL